MVHPVERDDYRVPLISTYPPERAQMDTDTDTVYPAIVPVNRESKTSHQTTKLHMNKLSTNIPISQLTTNSPSNLPTTTQSWCNPVEKDHERDDCVPLSGTYPPERAKTDTETDYVYHANILVNIQCIFCSVSSYSIASRGCTAVLQVSEYMTCQNCSSQFCTSCINELIQSVEGFKTIPLTVKKTDATYRKVIQIQKEMSLGNTITVFGPCCSFRVMETSSTLVKTPRLDPTVQCSRIQSIKNYRKSIHTIKANKLQAPTLDNLKLQQYFRDPLLTSHPGALRKKEQPKQLHMRTTKKRKRRNMPSVNSTYNPFSGAIFLPTFGLLIEGEVTNSHWYCDHHALARSQVDGTPGVPHCVLSHDCAKLLHSSNLCLPRISGSREVLMLVISAPEDNHQKRNITVEVIEVDQTIATSDIMHMKGENSPDMNFMKSMSFFSSEDMSPDVDVTIILGRFTIDSNKHPKMLLLRFSGMLANVCYSVQRRNKIAYLLYHQLRPIAGRQGYEVVRRGGSSGKTSIQSDQDLLDCIHDVPGLCPRRLRGVVILRGPLTYYLIYRNMESTKFVCYQYPPPKEGGSFKMPSAILYSYPVLCEFTYLKMMAIEVLQSLNINRVKHGLSRVCQGVLDCESRKVNESRKIYDTCDQPLEEKYLAFFDAFNKLHSYSMVCYPVGMHNDTFKDDDESLENKILMSIENDPGNRKGLGRGGCIMGTHFVYALLDW